MNNKNINKCSICEEKATRLTFGEVYCKEHSKEVFYETVRLIKLNLKNAEVKDE